jgi:hypothetical protein
VTKRADNVRWFANLRDKEMLGELFALDFFVGLEETEEIFIFGWSIAHVRGWRIGEE